MECTVCDEVTGEKCFICKDRTGEIFFRYKYADNKRADFFKGDDRILIVLREKDLPVGEVDASNIQMIMPPSYHYKNEQQIRCVTRNINSSDDRETNSLYIEVPIS